MNLRGFSMARENGIESRKEFRDYPHNEIRFLGSHIDFTFF